MSMTLILWKAPVVDDPDEAERLLGPYQDEADDSAFEASPDIARMADELRGRFPAGEGSPWASFPPEQTERLLVLDIRWGADEDVVDQIFAMAREYGLVLYDPQGPDIALPTRQALEQAPIQDGARFVDYLKIVAMGLVAGGVFWLGWWIDVPVLNWVLMIVSGFFLSVIIFLFVILALAPKVLKDGGSTPDRVPAPGKASPEA